MTPRYLFLLLALAGCAPEPALPCMDRTIFFKAGGSVSNNDVELCDERSNPNLRWSPTDPSVGVVICICPGHHLDEQKQTGGNQ